MAEFKVLLGVELDTASLSGVESQIKGIGAKPIDLTLNTKNIQSQISSIRSQIQALDGMTINLNFNTNWNNHGGGRNNGGVGGNARNNNGYQRAVAEANTAYNELMNLSRRINSIRIQIGGLDSHKSANQIVELRTQLRNLSTEYNNLKANFTNGMDFQDLTNRGNEIAQLQHQLTELRRVEEETRLAGIDTTQMQANIQALETRINGLLQTYRNLANGLTPEQVSRLATVFDETSDRVSVLESKLNDIAQKISKNFANGDFTNQFNKIQTSFDNLINKSDSTQIAFQEFHAAFNDLQNAINNNDMDAIINAYSRYEDALKNVKNQLDINARAEKQAFDTNKLENARKSLSSSIDIWLKNNSAATKQFGARLNELKVRLQNCDNVELNNIQAEFREIQKEAKLAGVATKSLEDRFKQSFTRLSTYFSAYEIFSKFSDALRSMYNNVVEVDTAMTGLYRVTDLTSQQYSTLYDNMITSAKTYGSTLDNIINATTDWVRAGFDADTSLGLAEITTMYQHISDLDYDVAAENLITAYNGFKDELLSLYDGDEIAAVGYIADIFNELDNNFAVTSAGLGEALTRSASALDVAGNSIQESAAMITGITEVTQDPEKAGSALKVLSLRLRGMKGQLEELGEETDENVESISKMQTQILNLTGGKVNIFNDDGSFKSTYEIMQGIAEVYDELENTDPTAAADLLETIAGKNRANDIAALISNWNNVEEALKSAMGAEGSAAEENKKHMDSIQGRLESLTTSWQAFSTTVVNSDFVKTIISGLTDVVDFLDVVVDKVGVFNVAIAGLSIGKVVKQITSVSKAAGGLSSLSDIASILGLAFPNAANGIKVFTSALSSSTSVIGVLKAAVSGLWTVLSAHPIIAVISAIGLAVAAFDHFHTSAKEANEKMAEAFGAYDDAKQKVINVNTELENTKTKMEELQAKGGLTFVEQQELDNLREATDLLKIQADLAEKEEKKAAKEAAAAAVTAYEKNYRNKYGVASQEEIKQYYDATSYDKSYGKLINNKENINAMLAAYQGMVEQKDAMYAEVKDLLDKNYNDLTFEEQWAVDEYTGYLETINYVHDSLFSDSLESLVNYKKALSSIPYDELTPKQQSYLDEITKTIDLVYQIADPTKWKQMQFDKIFDDNKSFANAKKELVGIASANKAVGVTVDDITQKYPELAQAVQDAGFTIEDLVNNINSEAGAVNVGELVRQAKEELAESMSDDDKEVTVEVEAEVNEASLTEVNEWLDSLTDEDKIIACDIIFNNDTSGWSLETFENKLAEAKKSIEETVEPINFSELIATEDFNQTVDSHVEKVGKLKDALKSLQSGEFTESDFVDLSKIFPELADNADDLDVAIRELLGTMNTDITSYFNDQFGKLETEEDVIALENFMNAVLKLGEVVGDTQFSIDIDVESGNMENLYKAISESVSGTGLSTDSIKNIDKMYSALGKAYDPTKLFEQTEHGIHLNVQELRSLQSEYESFNKSNINKNLQDLKQKYNDVKNELKGLTEGTDEYNQKIGELTGIESQIQNIQNLAAQYAGLTSAYNKWIEAQSSGNENDMYLNMSDKIKSTKELYEQGWIGTDDFRSAVQLMTDTDLSTASIEDVLAVYEKGMPTMEKFFTGTTDGLLNFLNTGKDVSDKLGKEWITLDDDGKWHIDFGVGGDAEIAKAITEMTGLQMSTEQVQILMRALSAAGFDINLDSAYTSIEDLQSRVEETDTALKNMGQTPVDINVNAEDANSELEKAKTLIEEIKNSDAEPKVKTAQLENAYAKVDALVARINQPAFMSLDVSEVDTGLQGALTLLQNYQTSVNNLQALEIKGADTSEIEAAKAKVDECASAINALPTEVKTAIGITTDEVDSESLDQLIEDKKITISASVDTAQASTDIDGLTKEATITIDAELGDGFDTIGNMVRGINSHTSTITIDAELGDGFDTIGNMVRGVDGYTSTITIDAELGDGFDTIGQQVSGINQQVSTITIDAELGDSFNNIGQSISSIEDTVKTITIDAELGESFNNVGNAISSIDQTVKTITIDAELSETFNTVGQSISSIDQTVETITIEAKLGSSFNNVSSAISSIENTIETITIEAKLGDSFSNVGNSISSIEDTVKTITIDAELGSSFDSVGNAISNIGNTKQTITIDATLGDSFNSVGSAISSISETEETITVDIEVNDEEVQNYDPSDKEAEVKYSVNAEEADSYEAPNKEAEVEYSVEDGEVQSYSPPDKEAVVSYAPDFGAIYAAEPPTLQGKVVYNTSFTGDAGVNGTAHVNGTAFSQGTTGKAYKQGDWGTKDSGVALGGELGTEVVVRDGRFFTIGDNGAEFFNYKKGDIIFNHKQSEELFKYGKVTSGGGRGKAYAEGTASVEGRAFSSGSGSIIVSGKVKTKSSSKNKAEAAKQSSKDTSEQAKDEFEETFDWIEIAIDRIERAIENLDLKANSVYRSWSERNNALKDEISEITGEIDIQQKGYERYMQQANSVGLDESWAELVRDGAIDIDTVHDEELAEKIKEYQEW